MMSMQIPTVDERLTTFERRCPWRDHDDGAGSRPTRQTVWSSGGATAEQSAEATKIARAASAGSGTPV